MNRLLHIGDVEAEVPEPADFERLLQHHAADVIGLLHGSRGRHGFLLIRRIGEVPLWWCYGSRVGQARSSSYRLLERYVLTRNRALLAQAVEEGFYGVREAAAEPTGPVER